MTTPIPKMTQADEALRLLAQMYARWFMRVDMNRPLEESYAQIRDVLYSAVSQPGAHEHLERLVEATADSVDLLPRNTYILARDTVQEVIQAGGSANAIIVGETDGFRHLCLTCSQDEQAFHGVRFFNARDRRPLLKPEIEGVRRSAYAKCQLCLQPLSPLKLVLFVLAGTAKHEKACGCKQCNRAGIAFLLTIYDCDKATLHVRLPQLEQVAAPSKAQCVERAIKRCWERGWYMLNKETVLEEKKGR